MKTLASGLAVLFLFSSLAKGDAMDMYGGTYASWPTAWNAIPGINDPNDGLGTSRLDFVGDSSNPGGYWAADANYVYFRLRVQDPNPASNVWNGTLFVLIDRDGQGATNEPDWGFAWDTRQDPANHGLELSVSNVIGASWSATRMGDRDGSSGQKITPPDFSLNGGDGYIRMVTSNATVNFGYTTFVDIAANWSFLGSNSSLAAGQTWRVQFGSINNANDHNFIDYDVAGNRNPTDSGLNWSSSFVVPEPSSIGLLAMAGILLGSRLRRR